MPHTRLLIDTDPGVDDSMMLQWACKSSEITIEAITTVFGNAHVDTTTQNARRNLQVAGRMDIALARGASKPLLRHHSGDYPVGIHGADGLGNAHLPALAGDIAPTPAAMLIVERIRQCPGELTLLAVGPLTNLALAVSLDPTIASLVRQVVIMGGAATVRGNISPSAEANIYNDPEAAHIVLQAGWPLTMVGLDVTMQTHLTAAYLEEIHQAGTGVTDFLSAIIPYYFAHYRQRLGVDTMPVHDSSALAYVLDDTLFRSQECSVDVETHGELTRGQTVVDFRQQWGKTPNVRVCLEVDSARLLAMYLARMSTP